MTWFECFLTNPICLIYLLFFLIMVGICIVECHPISQKSWHKFDFLCLIFASLGIFGILGENRKFIYTREANMLEHRINTLEWSINFKLDSNIYNRTFNATIYSPDCIELMNKDFENMYSWILVNKDSILKCIKEKQHIETLSLKFPDIKTGDKTFIPEEIEEFKHIVSEYNNVLDKYNNYQERANKNWIEFIYDFFAPIFLVLSLSYQFVRWFWEYKNKYS